MSTKSSTSNEKKQHKPDSKGKKRSRASKSRAKEPRFRPHKEDREAFAAGKLTPAAKRMNALVKTAFVSQLQYNKAHDKHYERMEALYNKVAGDVNNRGVSIVSADMSERVVFHKKQIVSGNQNAHMAKNLIDEYLSEMLGRTAVSKDDAQMVEFLANVIVESKGRILMTRNLVMFRRMSFEDERLTKAQKLLSDAFDVTETKLYWYCERRQPDGTYKRV